MTGFAGLGFTWDFWKLNRKPAGRTYCKFGEYIVGLSSVGSTGLVGIDTAVGGTGNELDRGWRLYWAALLAGTIS